jgi:F0F1-type ATP synthase gamma subunit
MTQLQSLLIKLANKLQKKYAQFSSLKEIIENAASYGESSANGIMNFVDQLKKDKASLSITITISSGLFGGFNVEVSSPIVDPSEFSVNYRKLPEQIKKYLEKYLKDFPHIPPGTVTLQWSGKTPQEITYK